MSQKVSSPKVPSPDCKISMSHSPEFGVPSPDCLYYFFFRITTILTFLLMFQAVSHGVYDFFASKNNYLNLFT